MKRNYPTRPQSHRYSRTLELIQYKWTGQVSCVQTTTRNFVKLHTYALLKQNNYMRIDGLPYHSSLFYKLNFVSRRQFFINIEKYPSKMQKVRNDPLLDNKIFKKGGGGYGTDSISYVTSLFKGINQLCDFSGPSRKWSFHCNIDEDKLRKQNISTYLWRNLMKNIRSCIPARM